MEIFAVIKALLLFQSFIVSKVSITLTLFFLIFPLDPPENFRKP